MDNFESEDLQQFFDYVERGGAPPRDLELRVKAAYPGLGLATPRDEQARARSRFFRAAPTELDLQIAAVRKARAFRAGRGLTQEAPAPF